MMCTGRTLCGIAVALALFSACGDGAKDGASGAGPAPLEDDGFDGAAPPPPSIAAGQVTFKNACAVPLSLFKDGVAYTTLVPSTGMTQIAVSALAAGAANVFMPYPNTTDEQCPAAYCDGWTALGGTPGTVQRQGWMWESPNATYAAYCNPNLSGRGICAVQNNCCGPGMVQDGTFGTTWEITPGGGGGQDFVDLSTNFGYGPDDPPHLCPYPANPNDCVSAAANIFFNVPVQWWSNDDCFCTTQHLEVTSRRCFEASCSEAYQHPTDDKQCACSSGASRGYYVEFCPPGSSLPAPPGTSAPAS